MRGFVSSLLGTYLLLAPLSIFVEASQGFNTNSVQDDVVVHPAACERVRITLNSGRKVETGSYKHDGDHIEFANKGAVEKILDKNIVRIELLQGSCPDIILTLKNGEKVVGYRRDLVCLGYQCKTEISQQGKARTIADSDIKTVGLKFKKTFAEKLKNAALSPLHSFSYLILLVLCSGGRCEDL